MNTIDKDTPVARGFTVGSLVQFETKSNYPGKIHARWSGLDGRTRCGLVSQVGRAPEQWNPVNGGYPCRRCFTDKTYGDMLRATRGLHAQARSRAMFGYSKD